MRTHPQDFYALIEAMLLAKGKTLAAAGIAAQRNFSPRVVASLEKAAVAVGSTTDGSWGGPLVGYVDLVGEWFSTLRNISLLDAVIDQGAKRVPADMRFVLTTAAAVGQIIDQAAWFALSKMSFEGDRQGFFTALSAVVLSDDLRRFSSTAAQSLVNTELANAVAGATNGKAVAILLDSVAPSASSGDARSDLQALFAAVSLAATSKPLLVASPQVVKQLALLGTSSGAPAFPDLQIPSGGSISGVPLLSVDELHDYSSDGDVLMLVDCSQLGADAGALEIDVSNQATLQMADSPTQAASNMVSMFQTNSTAIRTRRVFSLQKVRSACVAAVKNCSYGTGSP